MELLVIPYPLIDPVAIEIGPVAVRWYGLAYMAGILLGWLYARRLVARPDLWGGKPPLTVTQVDDFLLWITLGIVVGGRVGFVLFYEPSYFWQNPSEIPAVWHGGMSFHGGLLGVALAVYLFARVKGINALSLGDIASAATPFGLFFGRVANFINSEVVGRVSDVPWAMVFPGAGDQPRHPSQLYEAFLEGIVLFIILAHRHPSLPRVDAAGHGVRSFSRLLWDLPQHGRVLPGAACRPSARYRHLHAGHRLFHSHDTHRRMADLAGETAAGLGVVVMGAQRKALPADSAPLAARLKQRIADQGPISVHDYMEACLADRRAGYYVTRQPIGKDGDFITAPEVSQMFGELIGAWVAAMWQAMGEPRPAVVAELGPGRGTLMADALRAWRSVPKLLDCMSIALIETSPVLRDIQRETLRHSPAPLRWCERIEQAPQGPLIVIANEFIDALPVRQMRAARGRVARALRDDRRRRRLRLLRRRARSAATPCRSRGGTTTPSSRRGPRPHPCFQPSPNGPSRRRSPR